jgi:hypothetical protein
MKLPLRRLKEDGGSSPDAARGRLSMSNNDLTWEEKAALTAPRRSSSPLLWLFGGAAAVVAAGALAWAAGFIDPLGSGPIRTLTADFATLASGMRTDQNWNNNNDYMKAMVKNGALEVKANTTLFVDRKVLIDKENPLDISVTATGVSDEVEFYAGLLAYDASGKALTGVGGKPYFYALNNEKPKPGVGGQTAWSKIVKLEDLTTYFGKTVQIADTRIFMAVQSDDGSFDPVKLVKLEIK